MSLTALSGNPDLPRQFSCVVSYLSCVVWCCFCCVFVCETCFSSYICEHKPAPFRRRQLYQQQQSGRDANVTHRRFTYHEHTTQQSDGVEWNTRRIRQPAPAHTQLLLFITGSNSTNSSKVAAMQMSLTAWNGSPYLYDNSQVWCCSCRVFVCRILFLFTHTRT